MGLPYLSPYSLRTTLLAFVIVPLLGVMLLVGAWGLRAVEARMEERLQEDIELVARAIQLPLSRSLERGERGGVQQALDSAFRIDQVYGAYVYDERGELVAASGPRGPSMVIRREARDITAGGTRGLFEERAGKPVYSFFMPLSDAGGRISGLLQVTRHRADFQDDLAQLRREALMVLGALALLFFGVVTLGHHRAVGRHVNQLVEGMARVGRGERGYRVSPAGPHELRTLAKAMNAMLDSTDRSETALAHQRAEQQALEARLRESEKLAAIGQLAAGVAHELGSPLGVIDGTAQRALRRLPDGDALHGDLTGIRTEVARMERIVRQLMDFGRRNPLHRRPEQVPVIAQAVARRLQEAGAPVEIALHGPEDMPDLPLDRPRLEQALGNLLENGVQAARQRVSLSWALERKALRLVVEDDGRGVDPDIREHLFEPFFTTKPVGQGTGLGLSVAHAAVNDHGGELRVDRSPLGGARFTLLLPLEVPHG
ncbi:two-component sensor histidine kinase [Thioalkalivibrio denitrificans]|uniref:histidine kinase n=1 Tax=Thioalkalivibrio denitrificans TaxID=108003 RepID=A0A1V3NES4_9GAMM|nr:ATP-binding protein [Thioalkalivibrio denitrificans]OOG23504.1 two-component sensor histidine kinase [Thioalkalivibrio denitrificans]